jgi:hypothetical protein
MLAKLKLLKTANIKGKIKMESIFPDHLKLLFDEL